MRLLTALVLVTSGCAQSENRLSEESRPRVSARVRQTEDFEPTGDGSHPSWAKAEWIPLSRRPGGDLPYETRFKVLHSPKGVYVLMDGTDARLTTTGRKDFAHLWEEDVYEVFLCPDPATPVYFEYEVSPLNFELPLLVPNHRGEFMGWIPWHYEGDRKVHKAVTVAGGPQQPGASVAGWRAEIFIPFALFRGLSNVPPATGSRWRANFYRVDHDRTPPTQWHWATVGPSFHEYWNFGDLIFE